MKPQTCQTRSTAGSARGGWALSTISGNCNRPKPSLLPLKARMVRSDVVEALLYGCATWIPLKGHYAKLRTTQHRGCCFCKSPNKRNLSYKDALQRTECESIEITVRTRRLLWAGALLRMGDNRLPKRVISESSRTRENAGRGGKKRIGRTAWQMIFDHLVSQGTGAPPHLTLGYGTAQYTKGAVGVWSRG